MSKLESLALANEGLVHFTHPVTGAKVYEDKTVPVLDEQGNDTGKTEVVDDEEKPLGVWMVSPGSKEAREVETAVAKLARERIEKLKAKDKKQGMTPDHLHWMLTEKTARMMRRFANFKYLGVEGPATGVDFLGVAREFLMDPKYAHLADQVRAATADYQVFMQNPSDN